MVSAGAINMKERSKTMNPQLCIFKETQRSFINGKTLGVGEIGDMGICDPEEG
jgi:hypothetical protein